MSSPLNKHMLRAVALAKRGECKTSPNPPVGAVVVKKGKVIAEGYHSRAGGSHAEVVALKNAGTAASGADLYVTLEPCSTTGRTPPCTDLIIKSGISRVIIAARDPNPKHNGRGCRILRNAGVEVVEDICRMQGEELLEGFSKWITSAVPYVTLKMGMTFDGKIADRLGKSRWITGPESRRAVARLRARSDVVLIGAETAMHDNPSLAGANAKRRLRVILDSEGRLPLSLKVFNDEYREQTVVAVKNACSSNRINRMVSKGARVWRLPTRNGLLSLPVLMKRLGKEGVLRVLCEGGGKLAGSLIAEGLVDEYCFFIAPSIIGSENARNVVSCRGWKLDHMPELTFVEHVTSGKDILIRAKPVRK